MPQPIVDAASATASITEDDATLEAMLDEAHIPALMAALVHITGDANIIRGEIRPSGALFGDQQAGISAEHQAEIRTLALRKLAEFRDNGCKLRGGAPSPELIRELLAFMVGGEIGDGYVEFLMSELALEGADPYGSAPIDVPEAAKAEFHVVVIGAGMSGILAAIRLKEAGIAYTVIEKNDNVGGTWYQNQYPGCRVDSPNHTYSYSFEPQDWPPITSRSAAIRFWSSRRR